MSTVQLVGILNVTPDSFSDGNKFFEPTDAIAQLKQLFTDGASIVDIGAESTRPNAEPLTPKQEWQRLAPVLTAAMPLYESRLSIDTYHPETIKRAAEEFGSVFIANDVTGFSNPEMICVVAKNNLRCIVSHLPQKFNGNVQAAHRGELIDDINIVKDELLTKRSELITASVAPQNIILDPGIGFGKTPELNQKLLRFAELVPECNVMIGYSRKRFLGENRFEIEPNIAAGKVAIAAGAKYLRVHDVAAHKKLLI